MDRKYHIDNFERLLKERSDEFRMYPRSNVWHSIYNNIYPGRRWPSVIISIMLVITFPLVGYLNSNGTHQTTAKNNALHLKENYISAVPLAIKIASSESISKENIEASTFYLSPSLSKIPINTFNENAHLLIVKHWLHNVHSTAMLPIDLSTNKTSTAFTNNSNDQRTIISMENNETDGANSAFERDALLKYNIQNQQLAKKWNDKLALQIYASPSFLYGIFSNQKSSSSSSADAPNSSSNLNSSIGLEAGTAMQYSLTNTIKVKAGLQFNYANYNVGTATSSTANDINAAYLMARANDYGSVSTFHNEMYQFSLPVGLELKLVKSHSLQWSAGATIQPTYIAAGNAYLLSSESHNFIDESSNINKWNLNAGLETFITYKVDDMTWQFGPQFRYQFSPTYGKIYGVDERLAVFGVKIGVSKTLH